MIYFICLFEHIVTLLRKVLYRFIDKLSSAELPPSTTSTAHMILCKGLEVHTNNTTRKTHFFLFIGDHGMHKVCVMLSCGYIYSRVKPQLSVLFHPLREQMLTENQNSSCLLQMAATLSLLSETHLPPAGGKGLLPCGNGPFFGTCIHEMFRKKNRCDIFGGCSC